VNVPGRSRGRGVGGEEETRVDEIRPIEAIAAGRSERLIAARRERRLAKADRMGLSRVHCPGHGVADVDGECTREVLHELNGLIGSRASCRGCDTCRAGGNRGGEKREDDEERRSNRARGDGKPTEQVLASSPPKYEWGQYNKQLAALQWVIVDLVRPF
jgi:hypothetical protein